MGILEKNVQLLQGMGFWIDKNEPRGYGFYLNQVLVHNPGIYAIYSIFCGIPWYMYKHSDNFSEMTESSGNGFTGVIFATVYFTIVLKNNELKNLVQIFRNVDELHQPTTDHTKEINERTNKLCHFWSVTFTKSFLVFYVPAFVVTGIDGFVGRDIEQRIKNVYPFDVTQPGGFELAAFIFGTQVFYASVMTLASCMMLLCMFLNILGQLRILNYKMVTLRSSAENEVRQHARTSASGNATSMDGTQTANIKFSVDMKVDGSCARRRQSSSSQKNENQNVTESNGRFEIPEKIKIRIKMQDLLKECVAHHCELINCIRAFEKYWNPLLSANLAVCLGQVVVILTSSAVKDGNSSNILVHMAVMSFFYSMLGMSCYLSQKVTVESELLQESIYGCGWIESSTSFKNSIGIMVSMANKPIVITAAGFVKLSLDTYKKVLNSAYSSYMLLKSF